jgi:hypothetical protein
MQMSGLLLFTAMLPSLIELKLAAGRLRDEADVVELVRENRDSIDELRHHLKLVHPPYVARLDELLTQIDEPASGSND